MSDQIEFQVSGVRYRCNDGIWEKRGEALHGNDWFLVTQAEGELLSELTALRKVVDAVKPQAIKTAMQQLDSIRPTPAHILAASDSLTYLLLQYFKFNPDALKHFGYLGKELAVALADKSEELEGAG